MAVVEPRQESRLRAAADRNGPPGRAKTRARGPGARSVGFHGGGGPRARFHVPGEELLRHHERIASATSAWLIPRGVQREMRAGGVKRTARARAVRRAWRAGRPFAAAAGGWCGKRARRARPRSAVRNTTAPSARRSASFPAGSRCRRRWRRSAAASPCSERNASDSSPSEIRPRRARRRSPGWSSGALGDEVVRVHPAARASSRASSRATELLPAPIGPMSTRHRRPGRPGVTAGRSGRKPPPAGRPVTTRRGRRCAPWTPSRRCKVHIRLDRLPATS